MGLLSFIGFGLPETSGTFPLNVLHFAVPMFPVERAFYTLVCRIALDTVRRVMDLTSLHYRSESSAEPWNPVDTLGAAFFLPAVAVQLAALFKPKHTASA